jgi:hypothetical protein
MRMPQFGTKRLAVAAAAATRFEKTRLTELVDLLKPLFPSATFCAVAI